MKNKTINLLIILLLTAIIFAPAISAQRGGPPKTESRMVYHNGPVMRGASHVYFIYYGCWSCGMQGASVNTQTVLGNFVGTLGLSPYFLINSTYPDSAGIGPSGSVVYSGTVTDETYLHGNELTDADVSAIVADRFSEGSFPVDPAGIYLVFATPDVSSIQTGFCNASYSPYHARSAFMGAAYS